MSKFERKYNVSEIIRRIPVVDLLDLENATLEQLEKEIKREVDKASLALRWVRGIRSVKSACKNGGENG